MHTLISRRLALQRLGTLAALGATGHAAQAAAPRIVLGQSAALSGPAAQLGTQFSLGARLYFEQINASGGVAGQSIELRSLDDGYDPARCQANTERLVADGVFALFGYVGTPTTLAALPILSQAKLPLIAPFTGAMALREPLNHQVFHLRASYADETRAIVRQLYTLGLKKVAVLRQNDSYGQAGLDGVTQALAAYQLSPKAVAVVERNSTEVASAVKSLTAAQPDAVVLISAYKSCAAFIREARKAGYGGTFYNVSFVGTDALAAELGREALGVVVSQVMPSPYASTLPIVREYREALKAASSELLPNYTSLEGYIAARLLVEGLRRAHSLQRESLISALEGLQALDLGGFHVSYGAQDHVASRFVELSMLTETGGVRR
jgi:branched-chain amino acid transport system substrate-binding protein